MIIVVRCFTCGKVLADKWEAYARAEQQCEETSEESGVVYRSTEAAQIPQRSRRGTILDSLGITRICCRRHFLGNVDMIDML